jgi:hypothetical protein
MPIRMRRKARRMEKVENLYCTARAQHVMPWRRDHVAGSGAASRFKPSRSSCPRPHPACVKGKPNRGRDILALSPHGLRTGALHAIRHRVAENRNAGRPATVAMQDSGLRGHRPRSASRSLSERQPCWPLVRYESIRHGTLRILRRYCSDRTEPARRSLKFDRYPAKLLAMQRAAP